MGLGVVEKKKSPITTVVVVEFNGSIAHKSKLFGKATRKRAPVNDGVSRRLVPDPSNPGRVVHDDERGRN